jgi:[acyl-carrier-protein] S-malonyltransferase
MNDTLQPTPLIVLCPGQGAQHMGMGRAWAEQSEAARQVFQQADDVLDFGLSRRCFEGPEDQVHRTDIAQAAIYTTSVACWRGLVERGAVGPIETTAGLSLGEYTALHLAGALSFADGLKLVWQRGRFMQEAAEASPSGMIALVGADEAQSNRLCESAREGEVLVPANFNCPGQVVISGSAAACDRAMAVADQMGLRATRLTVAGAFHSPLMKSAAQQMAAALDQVEWTLPAVPVLSNVTGEPHPNDIDAIKRHLVDQITHPVRFESNLRWLIDHASGRMIELAPGKVISGLVRRIDRKIKVENCAEPMNG